MKTTLMTTLLFLATSAANAQSVLLLMGSGSSGGSGGGISVFRNQLGPAGSGTTSAIDTTGATGLYIWASGISSGITVSDNKANTWTQVPAIYANASNNVLLWYVDGAPTVGTGHTFTISAGGFLTWGVLAASGMKTSSSFDSTVGNSASSATTVQPGSLNPGTGKHLLIGVMSGGSVASAWTGVDSSFAIKDQAGYLGGTNFDGAVCVLIQSAGSAVNPTATFGSSASLVFGLYSFGGV